MSVRHSPYQVKAGGILGKIEVTSRTVLERLQRRETTGLVRCPHLFDVPPKSAALNEIGDN